MMPAPDHVRRRRSPWLRALVLTTLTAVAVEYGVLPALVTARHDVALVSSASPWLLAAALVVEIASVASYTGLTRSVLPRAQLRGWPTQLAIDVTGLGASHVLPGGGATAAALRYRLMSNVGITRRAALSGAAVETTLSDLALAGCYVLGVLMAVTEVRHHPVLVLTAVIGTVVLVATAVSSARVARGPDRPAGAVRRARSALGRQVARRWELVVSDLRSFLRDESRTWPAIGFAFANWLLDATCLWLCLGAFGSWLGPGPILVAYGFANLLGLLPVTPGGLGVIEGTLMPLLLGFGVTSGSAVLGVLTWRLMQFWLPVPGAVASYVGLRSRAHLEGHVRGEHRASSSR